jgi:hypothetical protein
MTLRSRLWLAGVTLFNLINLAGAAYAVANGEVGHAAVHIGLLIPGGYFMWRLASRARQQDLPRPQDANNQLEYLQESVDAIAVEVERIGEAQRFDAKLREKRPESPPLKREE